MCCRAVDFSETLQLDRVWLCCTFACEKRYGKQHGSEILLKRYVSRMHVLRELLLTATYTTKNSTFILNKTSSTHPLAGWGNHIRPSLLLGGPLGLVHHGTHNSGGSGLVLNRAGVLGGDWGCILNSSRE